MSMSSLIAFGSHTATHAILTGLEPAALERELRRPLEALRTQQRQLDSGAVLPKREPFKLHREIGAGRRVHRRDYDGRRGRIDNVRRSLSLAARGYPRRRDPIHSVAHIPSRQPDMGIVTLLGCMCVADLVLVSVLAIYQWVLAIASMWPHSATIGSFRRHGAEQVCHPHSCA